MRLLFFLLALWDAVAYFCEADALAGWMAAAALLLGFLGGILADPCRRRP